MALLFNRQFRLELGSVLIASSFPDDINIHPTLRIAFKVEKDLSKIPNSAEISVWNLAPTTRAKLSETQVLPTVLSVGYGDQVFKLYSGDLYHAYSQRDGANWVTKMSFKDGGKNQKDKRVNESAVAGSPIADMIKKTGIASGLGLGNLEAHLTNIRSKIDSFPRGSTVSGNAIDEFAKLMGFTGQNWSIQDGQIQVLIPGQALPVTEEVISAQTGMIGSPEIGDKGQTKFKALIRPGLFPGYPIQLITESGAKSGSFLIINSKFSGDTHGKDWQAECDCFPLGAKSRQVADTGSA